MNKFLFAASVATMFAAAPTFAQASDQENFEVKASVPGTCTIGNPGTFDMSALNPVTTAGSGALTLDSLGKSGVTKTQNFWVSCNDTNKMTLASANGGKLVRDGAAPTTTEADQGFTNKIAYSVSPTNYLPDANWQYQPALNSGDVNNYMNKTRGAIHQEVGMQIRIRSTDGSNAKVRPLAGNYSDTVTVTVQIAA
jgi:hypothetical protein